MTASTTHTYYSRPVNDTLAHDSWTVFASDTTPVALLKAGIYATIAVALKGGTWREASMVLMAHTLAMKPSRSAAKEVIPQFLEARN